MGFGGGLALGLAFFRVAWDVPPAPTGDAEAKAPKGSPPSSDRSLDDPKAEEDPEVGKPLDDALVTLSYSEAAALAAAEMRLPLPLAVVAGDVTLLAGLCATL